MKGNEDLFMSKGSGHSFSSVISIDPYKGSYLSGISSFLTQTSLPEYAKDQYAISYINTQAFLHTQISISKNIPDEDLLDAITNAVYDEMALDQAITYQIQFIQAYNNLDETNKTFHVFIVDPLKINEIFEEPVRKLKYIDTIIPLPLLYKSLYSRDLIDHSGVHCFLSFDEADSSITVYKEREFLFTKTLKYSITNMHERFCELYGERIEYEEFITFLIHTNLKETQSPYTEFVLKLIKELFDNVNDIITYLKRAYEIDKIEHVYVGPLLNSVTKLDELAEFELSIKSLPLEFNYGFETTDSHITPINAMMHIHTALPEDEKYLCNFSHFHRPPRFSQRASGKFLILLAASLVIGFAYPILYWVLTYSQSLQYDLLSQEYANLHNQKTTREATIKNKEADKVKVLALLEEEEKDFNDKKGTLIKIHEVKASYPMKAKILSGFTDDLNKFDVKLESLNYSELNSTKKFEFDLVSSQDRKITQLLEHLTKNYEGEFAFTLNKIIYDKESKVYLGKLKVKML